MRRIYSRVPSGLIDDLLDRVGEEFFERGFENCVEEMKRDKKCDAEIASELVKQWFVMHNYHIFDYKNSQLVPENNAAGLGKDELETNYWHKYFEEANHLETFWNDLFEEGNYNYRNAEVSNLIPDDPIQRFVLHFLRGWQRRLNIYILDEEIPEEERILVLKKQVANFAFFSRKKPFGSSWKLKSEADDLLRQALQDAGMTVPVNDSEGKQSRGIQGEWIYYYADKNISRSAADGPKPDDQDRKMYHYITRYAARSGHSKVHDSWTMVKASFSPNSKMIKCYAFSGHSESKKELHKMPLKWWEENSGEEAWEDGQKICFADVDHLQFGQYLVSALFNAQRSFIEDDFEKLTQHIAFEELSTAESVIKRSRRDMTVLDYGLFYDCVVNCVNKYNKRIRGATTEVLKVLRGDDTSSAIDHVWPLVSVGCENKKFAPEKDKLQSLLSSYSINDDMAKTICDSLCKISEKHLQELEKELKTIPKNFLGVIEKHLQQSKCGEDNVIGLLLQELLKLNDCDCYFSIDIEFVALDANHLDGKPFCEACACKVRFYSALPQLLRAIGSTGEDFDRFAPLFAKLK